MEQKNRSINWDTASKLADENFFRLILQSLDDPDREGLKETPHRFISFLYEFLEPYDPEFKFTTFQGEKYDEMITVEDIPFFSLCEHHILPFFGTATIAYIPGEDGRICGLSKLPRVLEMFSRRFQNQERITTQVAELIELELNPKGVGVSLRARHLCMEMRGVRKHDVFTTTTKLLGVFKDQPATRAEFMQKIKK